MDKPSSPDLLAFFKALADANRLKIIGLLARQSLSVEQLAVMLGLTSPTVSHHLSRLSRVGLVSARAESYYSVYRLETKMLEQMSYKILASETLPEVTADVDVGAYDRKVLKAYLTSDGRIKEFPVQMKKLQVVLRHVLHAFEPGVRYSEKQVNEVLKRYHEDTAYLRRSLVSFKYMQREGGGGEYWVVDQR